MDEGSLVRAYGAPRAPTKKPYISEATRGMIVEKNRVSKDLRRAGAVLGNALAYICCFRSLGWPLDLRQALGCQRPCGTPPVYFTIHHSTL